VNVVNLGRDSIHGKKDMAKIKIKDTEVTIVQVNATDYICLTDMIKAKDGDFLLLTG
jgi:hypothetical protein